MAECRPAEMQILQEQKSAHARDLSLIASMARSHRYYFRPIVSRSQPE
ncbi:hypothetical protein FHS09_000139 [Microbulbifer rhizosphaerae]|uniref:Uncharacterized protein n=1 Tax=Microbulbifer rhizosphaerae TaxID=1562603 RepID=A0A7W4Z729_9GAMM|nr:hypothetical protein [Microbulbifer rhizosphaerae]